MNANEEPSPAPTIGDKFKEFPAEVRWLLGSIWGRLPEERQGQLFDLIRQLPVNRADGLRKLYQLGRQHLEMTFGERHDVAIVGPANVGKSTLYNQLIVNQTDAARIGATPGTTRTTQVGEGGLFRVVDTPGADAVGAQGRREREAALSAAAGADLLIILFDAIQGIKEAELSLFHELRATGKPYVVALNKMDLLDKRERQGVLRQAAANLDLPAGEIIPISALKGEKITTLLVAIAKSEPALLAALGAALPAYRDHLAWQATLRAATSAAVVALTPIPIIDFIPLAAVQALLVLSIARIYQYQFNLKRARELLGSLGMGYLGRALFYELAKLGGPPTWIIAVAVAASTTVVVGYASLLWFDRGEKLTTPRLRELTRALTGRLVDRLKIRGAKRPDRRSLADDLTRILRPEQWGGSEKKES